MTLFEAILLIISGIAVGFVNTLAGGGSAISLSVLMMMGLSPAMANGTNRIAIIMQNIAAVLKEAEMDFSHVVKCSIFMKDMNDYADINAVYGNSFGENPPAREAVQESVLPKNVNVEISVIAVK